VESEDAKGSRGEANRASETGGNETEEKSRAMVKREKGITEWTERKEEKNVAKEKIKG